MNVVLNDANCPYYQLYGPPPSYETVIAQTRGKTSSSTPASPEAATGATRLNLPAGSNVITNPSVAPCFAYPCSPARLNPVVASMDPEACGQQSQMQCPNGLVSSRQQTTSGDVRFPQYCNAENVGQNMVRQANFCVSPLEYHQDRNTETLSPGDAYERLPIDQGSPRRKKTLQEHSENSTLQSGNYDACDSRERMIFRELWESSPECAISQVHGRAQLERYPLAANGRYGQRNQQQVRTSAETNGEDKDEDVQLFTSSTCIRSRTTEKPDEMDSIPRNNERRLCTGSFKFVSRRYASSKQTNEPGEVEDEEDDEEDDEEEDREGDERIARNALGSQERIFHGTRTSRVENAGSANLNHVDRVLTDVATSPQTNPSNNVIAGSFISAASRRLDATRTNADSDFESKRRLDRSKSLD